MKGNFQLLCFEKSHMVSLTASEDLKIGPNKSDINGNECDF